MALEEKVMQSILGTNKKQQILHRLKCMRVYVGSYMCTYIYYIYTRINKLTKILNVHFYGIKTNQQHRSIQQHYIQTQFDPHERYCREDIENKKNLYLLL